MPGRGFMLHVWPVCSDFTRLFMPRLAHAWQWEDKAQTQDRAAIQLLCHLKPNPTPKSLMASMARGVLFHIAQRLHIHEVLCCWNGTLFPLEAKQRLSNLLSALCDWVQAFKTGLLLSSCILDATLRPRNSTCLFSQRQKSFKCYCKRKEEKLIEGEIMSSKLAYMSCMSKKRCCDRQRTSQHAVTTADWNVTLPVSHPSTFSTGRGC